MWKKALSIAATGFLLTACGTNNNEAVPNGNETPMQNIDERERNWTPEMNNDQPNGTTGPNMDGLEDNGTNDTLIENDGTETLERNGNAEGDAWGANSTEDGGNTTGTGENGGSRKKDGM